AGGPGRWGARRLGAGAARRVGVRAPGLTRGEAPGEVLQPLPVLRAEVEVFGALLGGLAEDALEVRVGQQLLRLAAPVVERLAELPPVIAVVDAQLLGVSRQLRDQALEVRRRLGVAEASLEEGVGGVRRDAALDRDVRQAHPPGLRRRRRGGA